MLPFIPSSSSKEFSNISGQTPDKFSALENISDSRPTIRPPWPTSYAREEACEAVLAETRVHTYQVHTAALNLNFTVDEISHAQSPLEFSLARRRNGPSKLLLKRARARARTSDVTRRVPSFSSNDETRRGSRISLLFLSLSLFAGLICNSTLGFRFAFFEGDDVSSDATLRPRESSFN